MPPDLQTRVRLRKVVTAAAQATDEQPSQAVVSKAWQRPGQGIDDPKYLRSLGEWQAWLARYSQELGICRFSAGITADTAMRVRWHVQKQDDGGDWEEDEDLNPILEEYRNELQDDNELTRLQAWHYETIGEMFEVIRDEGDGGASWWIYGKHAVHFPDANFALCKDIPYGQEKTGTAHKVPRNQVTRLWIPDEMFPGLATSPMRASVDDLQRYAYLADYVQRTIRSRMAMNGGLWTPSEAHELKAPDGSTSKLDWDFTRVAQRALQEDDSLAAVLPFPFHYSNDLQPPQFVEFGKGLDEAAMSHREEARQDFARGINLPSTIASEGGPGGGNHWSEWLVDEKFFSITIAPVCDRIAVDRTKTFLWRKLLVEDRGVAEADIMKYRVYYDPAPVIVHPDRSAKALDMLKIGGISFKAAREYLDFTEDDAMTDESEKEWLKEITGKAAGSGPTMNINGNGGGGELPAGGENVTKLPPEKEPDEPKAVAAAADVIDVVERDPLAGTNATLREVHEVRSKLGRKLLAAAEVAMEEALRQAGVKVRTRIAGRKGSDQANRQAALACIDEDGYPIKPLGPHLAAAGVTENELLKKRFLSLRKIAAQLFEGGRAQQVKILRGEEGQDESIVHEIAQDKANESAAEYIEHSLHELAKRRLMTGPEKQEVGEVSGSVPARVIREAMQIADGTAAPVYPEDGLPTVQRAFDYVTADRAAARDLGGDVKYTWVHGYYGDPRNDFEPHFDLNGFTTTDPEGDADLAVDGSFPEVDLYQPGDHPGCTCEWVSEVVPAGA